MAYPLYDLSGHPLLADPKNKYNNLKGDPERAAQQSLAEILLGLEEPIATDAGEVEQIGYAIALQILFQMEQGATPMVDKSNNLQHPGNATVYRDRWLDPRAADIIRRVTGIEPVRFSAPSFGV